MLVLLGSTCWAMFDRDVGEAPGSPEATSGRQAMRLISRESDRPLI